MKFHLVSSLATLTMASAAAALVSGQGADAGEGGQNTTCYPRHWAVALYNSFDAIDVFGPLDILFYLAMSAQLDLSLVADTLDPVWMRPTSPVFNRLGSRFEASVNPTHTFAEPPSDAIDVLLVPGGPGARHANVSDGAVDFVRRTYPSVRYLVTICTGAGIAARAGVLDGRRATTSKASWGEIVAMGPAVKWVSPARWTVDGNVWTSSGVTAGLDLIFDLVHAVYSAEVSRDVQARFEYGGARDACDDPFAAVHGVASRGDCRA